KLTDLQPGPGFDAQEVLGLVAGLERYSKHPLSGAIQAAARAAGVPQAAVSSVSERPGEGLRGTVAGKSIHVTSRKKLPHPLLEPAPELPAESGGLECIILIDGRYAATMHFRDEPRADSALFIRHLKPRHFFDRVLLLSGDREAEVRYLADQV